MGSADERRGRSGTEIDQNQTGVQSSSGHREGRNVAPVRLDVLNGAVGLAHR